ncbi:hypothetical protein B9Z55_018089 [Caenorhabditis nigoni]|uniref:NR LBD domain-containing protein n=1 Tax=Caenorhabditis nigoni TaxID=1611254 RepID=A0A2G5TCJ3_9PELO|nr:hypothetical protein B9Z55_018089 [Caenorhabditis nigoni]
MNSKLYRRASTHDINIVLNIGLCNAMEWSNQLETFKGCTLKEKKIVLSEFGIAFVLVDQAFKTAQKSVDKGFWLLQNDTFLHTDYFLGVSKADIQGNELRFQAQNHFDFVNGLLNTIIDPLLKLQVDKFECVIIKTLLLMTPSYAGRLKIDKSKKVVSECLSELMSYCMSHHPETGAVRFGEIILLLSSIRCAVKGFYNQTKKSSLFDSSKFNNFVKGYFLS